MASEMYVYQDTDNIICCRGKSIWSPKGTTNMEPSQVNKTKKILTRAANTRLILCLCSILFF